jgi:DNA-binding MarR family transcriptional regulator
MARQTQYGRQRVAVLAEIRGRYVAHGRPPTVRELAGRFDVGPATMHSWLKRLAEEGLVEWSPGRHRSLQCTLRGIQLLSSQDEQSA